MRRPALALAAVCAFWGTIPLVADATQLPPVAIVFGRVWIAAAGLGAWLAVRSRIGRLPTGPRLFSEARGRVIGVGALLSV
ncbi:MAG: hypothetical protein ACR2H3_06695, partial [Acidimicrobiales bacterium]